MLVLADEETAAGMHGFAAGTYPFLKQVPPQQFIQGLSTAAGEMQAGATQVSGAAEKTRGRASAVASASEEASANVQTEASAAEDNEQVSPEEFQRAASAGGYAMHWDAHGHRYALSNAINDAIRAGHTVIANVSRTVIAS